MAALPYKLSCSLFGHNMDVRSIAVTKDSKIISGSRDMTAKVWSPNQLEPGYRETLTLSSHTNFVSCVAVMPPNPRYPNGLIITGSNDQAVRLFDETLPSPLQTLKGHTNTVCKIVLGSEENTILTSSWDQTAKLWDLLSCKDISTFAGHEAAVWSVLQLPNGLIVTASADKKIKIWIRNGSCLKTLTGHTDCVRDLAMAGSSEILSCSNDATVRHWNVESGLCLNTYYGHANFIYGIVSLGSAGFLTCSEDKTVKVWNGTEVTDTIPIPACSVWCIAALLNGDIVAGSSDGVIRVFSADVSRQAAPDQLKAYEEQVAATSNAANQEIGGVKVSSLPGKEALFEPGKSDGQTKLIREDGAVIAYGWDQALGQWSKIGDVMGAAGTEGVSETGRPTYNGKEYDYVFSVDIEEGKPPLKLPYNKGEDPWFAAQKFIHDNHLSQQFLEQVANFIVSNSSQGGEPASFNSTSDFVDPFTGSGRYIPAGNAAPNGVQTNFSDPFTGESRYTAQSSTSYFPQREFLRFDQANLKAILAKLLEFNKKSGDGNQVLSEARLEELVKICEPNASCTAENILTLDRLLEWPQELVFPVLDVMRLAIRNPDANNFLCTEDLLPSLMKFLAPGTTIAPNNMLALRVLSNMLAAEAGEALASRNKIQLLNIIRNMQQPFTKPLQVAMATLLLNMAVVLRRSETPEGRLEALTATQHILPVLNDQEALFRGLVALGTLLTDSLDSKSYSTVFKPIVVKYQRDDSLGVKIQQCSQQIINILQ